MFRGRIDLPLSSDPSTRLLPWIISVMVYLAVIMQSGALALAGATASWERGLSGRYTVQLPPIEGETGEETQTRISRAIRILEGTKGIVSARQVPLTDVAASLEPWLGAGTSVLDLPLPYLIDVTLGDDPDINLDQLRQQLAGAVDGAALDDHGVWRGQLSDLIGALQLLAATVILLIGASAVIAVIFATRSGIEVHREVIQVLHLIGATDGYIARQFQRHVFGLALKGSLIGALLAFATLGLFIWGVSEFDPMLMPGISLGMWQWASLCLVPALACFIAMRAARTTVMRALRHMQ
jgi:cell division transport system permease protein